METSHAKYNTLDEDQFTKAPIQVGMDLVIEFRFGQKGVKSTTNLVGYSRDDYLIIKTPRLNGKYVNYSFYKNIVVIVRYFLDGSAFGFQTAIIRIISTPFHLTFIEYPKHVEQMSLRGSPRIQMVIPFEREGGDPEKEMIMNLSGTGALLLMTGDVQLNDEIKISFLLPDGKHVQEIPSMIRRVDMSSKRVLGGVQFDTNHQHYQYIEKYIKTVVETLGVLELETASQPQEDES